MPRFDFRFVDLRATRFPCQIVPSCAVKGPVEIDAPYQFTN
ncbi:hypothetical protein [Caudoviricetes sp.]|nr:hypothetical protein [Caudoviricetes sp.]